MEITDSIVLRQPDWTAKEGEMPDRARVRACGLEAKWKNISIEQCENEGKMYVGLSCIVSSVEYSKSDIAIQIAIEDIPVLMNQMRQAYKKQVVKQHLNKWGNNND